MANGSQTVSGTPGGRGPQPGTLASPAPIDVARPWWQTIGALFVAAVGATILVALATGEASNEGFVDGAAVVAFIAAIAAGVERVIELTWAKVDRAQKKGAWWPLSEVTDALTAAETGTNTALQPLVDNLARELADLTPIVNRAQAQAADLAQVRADINKRLAVATKTIAAAQALAPGSTRVQAVARAGTDFVEDAQLIMQKAGVWSDNMATKLNQIDEALTSAGDLVASFKDNPARRAMSLAMGVTGATFVGGLLSLNLFTAILGRDTPPYMTGVLGVVATSIVMGLGTNPTHEIINALERRKRTETTLEVPVSAEVTAHAEPPVAPAVVGLADRAPMASTTYLFRYDVPTAVAAAPPALTFVSRRRTRTIRRAG